MNSLTFSVVSSVAAGVGLVLLAGSLVTLRTASQQCESRRDYLASLPDSTYYYLIYDVKDCLLTSAGLTVSRLHFLSCEISVSLLCRLFCLFSSVQPCWFECLEANRKDKKLWLKEVGQQAA